MNGERNNLLTEIFGWCFTHKATRSFKVNPFHHTMANDISLSIVFVLFPIKYY